ncbi:MAG: UDP-2,4-diacetamido-2,4,6-trideoxy-beta-L-altropyranose hydrolase [Sulfurospirillum cavolei]|nr:UDP-2,4-diacetamido-2,4,6-trideoxy-beta-L-altropyranose hydrolase [Sulfurospirillum cavolei]
MKTLIRADSSSSLGLGHIMRDLVLAQSLEGEVLFACQALEGNIIDQIPYDVSILQTNEPDELIELIRSLHVTFLVIDHYGIDAAYERAIKEATGVRILSFDDTYRAHHCDILLNHNLYADASFYTNLVPKGCELRCGSAYTLIREEFKDEKTITREKIYDVLIAMGGSDAGNLTLAILKILPKSLHVSILTTSANAHLSELQRYVLGNPKITLHINSKEVAKIMNQSTLAIVTPSSIVYEVLFMELPFIAIKVASNQDDMYRYLEEHDYPVMHDFEPQMLKTLIHAWMQGETF